MASVTYTFILSLAKDALRKSYLLPFILRQAQDEVCGVKRPA
jgi:hypothetical protein